MFTHRFIRNTLQQARYMTTRAGTTGQGIPAAGSGWSEYSSGKKITGYSVRDSDVFQNQWHEYRVQRTYQGRLKAVIHDLAGTVVDCGCFGPVNVFIEGFNQIGLPITADEARGPMGQHKRMHIYNVINSPSVRTRFFDKFQRYPTDQDVDSIFAKFVPMQLKVLPDSSQMISGVLETMEILRTRYNMKIGCCSGYTRPMVDIVCREMAKQGYIPDASVAADEVKEARPAPFMVWKNLMDLKVHPIQAVVKVDDTTDGILEGLTAGCWTIGLAKTGNYLGMSEKELDEFEQKDPIYYQRVLKSSYDRLSAAGAHYVVDSFEQLPRIIDDINRRLAMGEKP